MSCAGCIKGAAGLARAGLRIELASDETIGERRAICAACEHPTGQRGRLLGTCKLCGCFVQAKTMLDGEKCPAGKW